MAYLISMTMNKPHKLLAEKLLHISAIKLQPESPFIWASGWNSPIYTDNRILLSYPDVRNFVKVELARTILENYPEANAIAGVATASESESLNLRSSATLNGLGRLRNSLPLSVTRSTP